MNVGSLESSTWCSFLSFQITEISLLDHVKGLIEAYETKFVTKENIILSAKMLIEKVSQLEDMSAKRECLCRLLKIEIEEVQNLLVPQLATFLNLETLPYDIQHNQAKQLIHLEKIISEIMEVRLKSNELNLIIPICSIYQNILEHLWMLPYLEFGNHCFNLLTQNKDYILSNMKRWIENLYQLASEKKIEPFIPKNLEKAVLRLFEPLPETIKREIEEEKSAIHKSGEISLTLLEIIAGFYGNYQYDFRRAIFHTEAILKILLRKPSTIFQEEEILVNITHTHGNLVIAHLRFGQNELAFYHLKKALETANELRNYDKLIFYLERIGSRCMKLGQGEFALPFYQEALALAEERQDYKSKIQIFGCLAEAYLSINKNDKAIQSYQTALDLTENEPKQVAIYYNGIGQAHANAQCYPEAEEAYRKALEFLQTGDIFMAISIHKNLTGLFADSRQYEKALFYAEKTLKLTQDPLFQTNDLKRLDNKLNALIVLGNMYGKFGNYEKELEYKEQALEITKNQISFPKSLGMAYAELGSAYRHAKRYAESIDCYKKALEIVKEPLKRVNILVNLGNAFIHFDGNFAKAIKCYEAANEISNQNCNKNTINGLGICYAAMGRQGEAIKKLEEFICLSRKSNDLFGEAAGYQNLGEIYRKTDPKLAEMNYCKSIDIYATLHRKLKNDSAWQITFFELQAIPILRLEELLLEQKRGDEALQLTDFRRSRALVSALAKKVQLPKEDFLYSGVTAQEMQALAQKLNTCLIIYSFPFESKDSITVWVIPSHGEIICKPLPLGILTKEFKEAKQIFKTFPFIAETRTIATPLQSFLEELTRGEPDGSTHSSNLQAFKDRLKDWYEIFIAPIANFLPKDPQQVVTIIPDGYLAQIPFAAFLDKDGDYLIEKHPLSIAPSIGILKLLDEIPKDFSENSLVIGNPNTSECGLKFAEEEAQTTVAPLLETASEKILLQDKATVQRAVEGMPDARWIHLACHGSIGKKSDEKIDPHSVFEGLFKLTPDEIHPKGYLHAQEIVPLTLRTELVFMSACFSGRGKLHREGSVGPVWSFLAAGALSTVATYWRLPDTELTLQMVKTFYRHLLGTGVEKLNKAQALQKAMLVGIEQARERPDRWGAFFLSGLHE
ncbi:CHAT domain-containing protein [Candidatus Protochlamydia sp. W-9]|uniref:CHAT domain-containing protein n=1 Tax=Candidatus Protochlamydia sp. W-9 TaxID=1785087 RepID=UPI00096A9AFE|nr:CHAT domain-containing protein [Candidatus Protochlamydia sp. W-9]